MNVPPPWAFVLLALAAYRLWRLAARDSITADAREAVTGYDDDHAPALDEAPRKTPRVYLSALLRCPWCLGFWLSLATACVYWAAPHAALVIAFPLAVSAVVGLLGKLDA